MLHCYHSVHSTSCFKQLHDIIPGILADKRGTSLQVFHALGDEKRRAPKHMICSFVGNEITNLRPFFSKGFSGDWDVSLLSPEERDPFFRLYVLGSPPIAARIEATMMSVPRVFPRIEWMDIVVHGPEDEAIVRMMLRKA